MDEQSARAYRDLKRMMVEGGFAMDAKLPEAHLAQELGLSRTPVRHALNRLEAEGFVVYEPRRGHRLRSFTAQDAEEIYGVRALVESEAVRLAALRGLEPKAEADLTSLIGRMEAILANPDGLEPDEVRTRFLRLNHRFHAVLYGACGNRYLLRIIRQVTELPLVLRHYFNFSDEQLHASHQDHQSIFRALRAREPDRAAALVREHILAARDRMLVTAQAQASREERDAQEVEGWDVILEADPR